MDRSRSARLGAMVASAGALPRARGVSTARVPVGTTEWNRRQANVAGQRYAAAHRADRRKAASTHAHRAILAT